MSFLRFGWVIAALQVLDAASALASPWSDALKARMDEVVARNFRNATQAGLVIGVVHGDETYVWSYGERALGSAQAPTGDTFFEMGSITKTFTNTLLALEVNRGRVRLADPVEAFWPELKGTDAGMITLEQLATHTSGLPRMPDNFEPADPTNPYQDYDLPKLQAFLQAFKQKVPGPYASSYSNLGMGLLGYLLSEKLNGLDFGTYVKANLTAPLGMKDTKLALEAGDFPRAAQGYGSFFELTPFWDLNVLAPAGALKTTVNDLLKYLRFNLRPGSDEIGQAAELAQKPRALTDVAGTRIGLAWFSTRIGTHSVVAHGGATGGYRANLVFDRENQLGFVVLSNTAMAPYCIGAPVFEVECQVPEWKAVDPQSVRRVLGAYYSAKLGMKLRIFLESGILGVEQDGAYRFRLWLKSDSEVESPEVGATIRFRSDEQGRIEGLTLLQGGQTAEFIRQD